MKCTIHKGANKMSRLNALKKNMQNSFESLANQIDEEDKGKKSFADSRFWEPSVDKSGSGFAVIRFLPAFDSTGKKRTSWVKWFSHNFAENGKWYIENCPTTIGEDCPVCQQNR